MNNQFKGSLVGCPWEKILFLLTPVQCFYGTKFYFRCILFHSYFAGPLSRQVGTVFQVEFLIWSPEWDCRWLYVVTILYKVERVTYCFPKKISVGYFRYCFWNPIFFSSSEYHKSFINLQTWVKNKHWCLFLNE